MSSVWMRRGRLLCLLALVSLVGCCLSSTAPTSAGNVYFVVYNFSENPVKASVAFTNTNGDKVTKSVLYNSATEIKSHVHATLTITCEAFAGPADSDVTVTFTFPNDANVQAIKTISRDDMTCNNRARIGVFDPNNIEIFFETAD